MKFLIPEKHQQMQDVCFLKNCSLLQNTNSCVHVNQLLLIIITIFYERKFVKYLEFRN